MNTDASEAKFSSENYKAKKNEGGNFMRNKVSNLNKEEKWLYYGITISAVIMYLLTNKIN